MHFTILRTGGVNLQSWNPLTCKARPPPVKNRLFSRTIVRSSPRGCRTYDCWGVNIVNKERVRVGYVGHHGFVSKYFPSSDYSYLTLPPSFVDSLLPATPIPQPQLSSRNFAQSASSILVQSPSTIKIHYAHLIRLTYFIFRANVQSQTHRRC